MADHERAGALRDVDGGGVKVGPLIVGTQQHDVRQNGRALDNISILVFARRRGSCTAT